MGEVERKDHSFLLLQVIPVPIIPDPGCGSLWLPAEGSPIPGADSERREEDSFDSDSTATLLK